MTNDETIWTGRLTTTGRKGEEFEARIVRAPGAWLDAILSLGEGLRLERKVGDAGGEYWTPISPYQVNAAKLVIALAASAAVKA